MSETTNGFGSSENGFTKEMLNGLMNKMVELKLNKQYFGDKDTIYVGLVRDSIEQSVVDAFSQFENVTIKKVNEQYLPDKDSIYFYPVPVLNTPTLD